MKKPIRLIGVEDRSQPCYFIHNQGLGYWFISLKQRTIGEASSLVQIVSKIEKLERDNNYLILDICTENKDRLVTDFLSENEKLLSEEDLLKYKKELEDKVYTPELNLLIENYVRELLSTGDVQHPILYKYRDRILSRLDSNIMFQYQLEVVSCALKHRLITEEKYIVKNEFDDERGHILVDDIGKYKCVGEINPDLSELGEFLTLQIYQFVTNDFAGKSWETTKIKADLANKSATELVELTTPVDEDTDADWLEETTEKKPLALTSSDELNNQPITTGMIST
jgi:hypothetical protein